MTAPSTTELRRLLAAATGGEWRVCDDGGHPGNKRIASTARRHVAKVYASDNGADPVCVANAALIVAAHNALHDLLDAADRLERYEAKMAKLTELLTGSTERMEKTLTAMDKYNEANGTAIIGPSLLGLGTQIAGNRAVLAAIGRVVEGGE